MELVLQPESGRMIVSSYRCQLVASQKIAPILVQQMSTPDLGHGKANELKVEDARLRLGITTWYGMSILLLVAFCPPPMSKSWLHPWVAPSR